MGLNLKQINLALGSLLLLYLLSYGVARATIFHRVERYAGQETLGVEAKANPRQDYIAKKDRPAGEGWQYQLFLPVIKAEEGIINFLQNL